MVTIILSGGLGNQMFQYASAKALTMRLNTSLALETYSLTKKKTQATVRPYELDIFNINAPKVSTLRGKIFVKARPYIYKHRLFFQKFGFLTDTAAILYQPVVETIKGNIIMSGHFQNEKYFENIETELRADFTFKKPLSGKNKEIANNFKNTEPVAVHVRRGDYLTNANAAANFVTCGKEYYENAIRYIENNVDNPTFYIFSEDIEWVKKNIDFKGYPAVFIDWNRGNDNYADMQLMSLCKHNIIANSSFSWWGAWLNANLGKIVIAPGKWFQDESKNQLLDGFLPEGWIKM